MAKLVSSTVSDLIL